MALNVGTNMFGLFGVLADVGNTLIFDFPGETNNEIYKQLKTIGMGVGGVIKMLLGI